MSAATPSWFRQQQYPPDCSRITQFNAQPTGISKVGHTHKVPADTLHNPGLQRQPWFSSVAACRSTGQPACRDTLVADLPHQHTSPQPDVQSSRNTSPSCLQYSAQAAPGALLPVSQVMSRAPLPGAALKPSSPWKQTSPYIHAHTSRTAPSTSNASVIIVQDTGQPTLAETLGFADSPQQSQGTGRQASAPQPVGTGSSQLHHMIDKMRAAEIVPQSAGPPSQAEQALAKQGARQNTQQTGALSQPGLLRLVNQVEATFAGQQSKFNAFLGLVHEYQAGHIDKRQFESQVSALA